VIRALLAPPLCWSCGAPAAGGLRAARAGPLCGACRRTLRFLAPEPAVLCGVAVWAPVAYEGPARDLVTALKFHGATKVAGEMAALIVANAPARQLAGALVPVPLHPARRRRRGFNQADLIARAVGDRAELPTRDCLGRCGDDAGQVGRGRAARLLGPAGSIRATGPVCSAAVLVDDVATTGATLAACAAALRSAGAERVSAIAFARTAGR
jgi:ComF family protein